MIQTFHYFRLTYKLVKLLGIYLSQVMFTLKSKFHTLILTLISHLHLPVSFSALPF